jgi:hypothetical protein
MGKKAAATYEKHENEQKSFEKETSKFSCFTLVLGASV